MKPALTVEEAKKVPIEKMSLDEKAFRWMLNENQMATEKLSEGIRKFAADQVSIKNSCSDVRQRRLWLCFSLIWPCVDRSFLRCSWRGS